MRRDAWFALGGLVVLAAAAVPVAFDPQRVPDLERTMFRALNGGAQLPSGPVWVVMQLGMIAVVPAGAVVALLLQRRRLALSLVLAGAIAYVAGKVVKQIVERGRPAALLDDVSIQGAAAHGLGFVSGHSAVAFALATVLMAVAARNDVRVAAITLAAAVALARVHVGAHLPLDVVGGAGLGVAAGGVARALLLGSERVRCS